MSRKTFGGYVLYAAVFYAPTATLAPYKAAQYYGVDRLWAYVACYGATTLLFLVSVFLLVLAADVAAINGHQEGHACANAKQQRLWEQRKEDARLKLIKEENPSADE